VVSNMICQALKGEPLTIYGEGAQTRSFQFVDDLVEGIVRLMGVNYEEPVKSGKPRGVSSSGIGTDGKANGLFKI